MHVSNDDEPIEARVRRLEAAERARALVAAYAGAVDAQDAAALERIFAADMVLSTSHRHLEGREAVMEYYRGTFERLGPRRHFVTNTAIDQSGPEIVARSYLLYVSVDGDTPLIGWGRYVDTFGWRDDELLFVAKSIAIQLEVDARTGWAAQLLAAGPG